MALFDKSEPIKIGLCGAVVAGLIYVALRLAVIYIGFQLPVWVYPIVGAVLGFLISYLLYDRIGSKPN